MTRSIRTMRHQHELQTMQTEQITGLTASQVEENRLKYGENTLTPPPRTPAWKLFLDKFRDPLIIILLIAGALSVGISCYEYWGLQAGPTVFFEPTGIFAAILLATGLAFYFEQKADKEFAILNKVNDDELIQVIRDSNPTMIPKREVVFGDIVVITTGMEIPADGQLLEAVSLNVDESTLTGEPMAHKTTVEADFDPDATFPSDHVMRGTKVMEGHGLMRVTAVGDHTENGKVFEAARIDDQVKTPLDEQFEKLGRMITRFAYAVAIAIVMGRVIMYFMNTQFEWMSFMAYLLQTFMIAVTLVVVSVPEGLPMAVTLALAYSMRRMLKTNNLVRKLHACETMGATTVICTDKTGTLTCNQMRVSAMKLSDTIPHDTIMESIAVNSTAELDLSGQKPSVIGNPTEGALLLWLREQGADYRKIRESVTTIDELPFTTERKYMATAVVDASGRRILYVKGAPEIVFAMSDDACGMSRTEIDRMLLEFQSQGMRTLGFAYKNLDADEDPVKDGKLITGGLTFMGIAAIADPIRPDVADAVKDVADAGIDVKIVTGDTPATAREIGRQIGIWKDSDNADSIITGQDFEALDDEQLLQRVDGLKIIARARPMDKKRLVEALQSKGEVVAVTGDGTNDAPALKAAQVGLSMGDGTSVAKEASDITIIDNSFSSIGKAVMWGRSLYRNIQRFILFQMTVNLVACLIVLCGAFMGMQSPLTVTQMLWVNLIMDTFAAMALASLPPTPAVMHDAPRNRSQFIITQPMLRFIVGTGGLFFVVLLAFLYYLKHTDLTSLTQIGHLPLHNDTGLSAYELSLFFTTFVFLQFWNMFNARAFETGRSAFHFKDCEGFVVIAAMILTGQILIVNVGDELFNVVPLHWSDWLIITVSTSSVLWIGELLRWWQRRRLS